MEKERASSSTSSQKKNYQVRLESKLSDQNKRLAQANQENLDLRQELTSVNKQLDEDRNEHIAELAKQQSFYGDKLQSAHDQTTQVRSELQKESANWQAKFTQAQQDHVLEVNALRKRIADLLAGQQVSAAEKEEESQQERQAEEQAREARSRSWLCGEGRVWRAWRTKSQDAPPSETSVRSHMFDILYNSIIVGR